MSAKQSLRFVPLGGLGEIGMNCFALEQDDEILLVDCGVAFSNDGLGSELAHPDFEWIIQNQERLVGLVITHGHEDHIGAVPFLLAQLSLPLPVFAPVHARELLMDRYLEQGTAKIEIETIVPRQEFLVGSFLIEGIPVAHSIIDALALRIETNVGTVLHTGDFSLDPSLPPGLGTDAERLAQIGQDGVRLLLSDSTNVDQEARVGDEDQVGRALLHWVQEAPARVLVGLFSSNVHRLVALAEVAQKTDRKLCFIGRSLKRHQRIARSLGRLSVPSDLVVDARHLKDLPAQKVLVVAGGCQGDGASTLSRMSKGEFLELTPEPGDLLLLSSRPIPGNERRVMTMVNDFSRWGVRVVSYRDDPRLHVSGHASRDELSQMIRWLQPQTFIPVHGTLHHLRAHEMVAKGLGILDTRVVENGQTVRLFEEGACVLDERVKAGVQRVSKGGRVLGTKIRRRRGELARGGVVFLSAQGRGAAGSVQCSSLGIVALDDDEAAKTRIAELVRSILEGSWDAPVEVCKSKIRSQVRSLILSLNGERPRVELHLETR